MQFCGFKNAWPHKICLNNGPACQSHWNYLKSFPYGNLYSLYIQVQGFEPWTSGQRTIFLFKMLSCVKITTCVDILRTTVTHCTLAPCMVSVSELLGTVKKMFKNVFLSQQFRLRWYMMVQELQKRRNGNTHLFPLMSLGEINYSDIVTSRGGLAL